MALLLGVVGEGGVVVVWGELVLAHLWRVVPWEADRAEIWRGMQAAHAQVGRAEHPCAYTARTTKGLAVALVA